MKLGVGCRGRDDSPRAVGEFGGVRRLLCGVFRWHTAVVLGGAVVSLPSKPQHSFGMSLCLSVSLTRATRVEGVRSCMAEGQKKHLEKRWRRGVLQPTQNTWFPRHSISIDAETLTKPSYRGARSIQTSCPPTHPCSHAMPAVCPWMWDDLDMELARMPQNRVSVASTDQRAPALEEE